MTSENSVRLTKESPLMHTQRPFDRTEAGFALVLSLLALLLLTFLGLTLAVTTSTELQIATNHRWSEQARYVAEAGVEAGRLILRGTTAWEGLVPAARTAPWTGVATPTASPVAARAGIRDYENFACDKAGAGMGYGRVLDDGGVPQQYISTFGGETLGGSFTLWVRRPLHYLPDGTVVDWGGSVTTPISADPDNNNLVLVAEGVAPFSGGALAATDAATQGLVGKSKATYVIEVALSRVPPTLGGCDNPLSGQKGGGQGGENFAGCSKLTDTSMDAAVVGAEAGTGGGTRAQLGAR
jgi:hypothetical protein